MSMENRQKLQISEDLRKWVRERWVDIGAPKKGGGFKPCGRSKGEKRKGYPKCVPAAKAARMTKGQRRSAVKRKRAAGNPGGKPTMVSTFKEMSSYSRILALLLEGDLHKKGSELTAQSHDLQGKTRTREVKKNNRDINTKIKSGGNKVFYAREGGVEGTPTEKHASKIAKRTGRDFEAGSIEHSDMDPDVPGNRAHKQLKNKYGSALANLSRHATTGQGQLSRKAKKLARRLGIDISNQQGLHRAAYSKSDFGAKQESPVEKAQQMINRQRRIGHRAVIRKKKKEGYTVVGTMGSGHFEEQTQNKKSLPFAVCTKNVGRKNKAKYERCVMKVKESVNEDNLLESYVASYVNLAYILEAKLCPKGKAAAKRKFKVYPSAYANMYASAVCSGKVTPGGKKK